MDQNERGPALAGLESHQGGAKETTTAQEHNTEKPPVSQAYFTEHATAFLQALDGDTVCFRTFDDNKERGRQDLTRKLSGTLAQHGQALDRLNEKGAGIFAVINEGGDTDKEITKVRALFIDFDNEDQTRSFADLGLEPSVVVESSPGKHHVYWLVDDFPVDEFREAQKTLIRAFGTDRTVKNLSRVMRLPGFYHKKGMPFQSRIIHNTGRRYSYQEVREWLTNIVANLPESDTEKVPANLPEAKTGSKASQTTVPVNLPEAKTDRYAENAYRDAIGAVMTAPEGQRNDELNRQAHGLYSLVQAGRLDEQEVTSQLERAAAGAGLEGREVTTTLESARQAARPNETGKPEVPEWGEVVPLDNVDPPRLPIDEWPEVLAEYAKNAAAVTETPEELAAMTALGCIAAVAQKRFTVQVKPDYSETLSLYVPVVMPPSTNKSAEHKRATKPLVQWEAKQREEVAAERKVAESLAATHKARVQDMRKLAAKEKDPDKAEELARQLADLESKTPIIPTVPRLFTSDVTSEHLATMMAENGEAMAVISSEGGIFETMAGRYSQQVANIDVYLQGFSGDPVRVDRGSKGSVVLDNPRLTMVLTVQPDVLAALSTKPGFRGRGLLGRCLFVIPPSNLGKRTGNGDAMCPFTEVNYQNMIQRLIDGRNNEPVELTLSNEARAAWREFWLAIEAQLAPGGELQTLTDWAGKLPGAVARIAALFHVAHRDHWEPISGQDMQAAISTGKALTGHAKAAFGVMGADPGVEDAKLLLGWIKRHGLAEFKRRDAHYHHTSRFAKADELQPGLDVLEERGYLRKRQQPAGGRGRPSATYEVNPAA